MGMEVRYLFEADGDPYVEEVFEVPDPEPVVRNGIEFRAVAAVLLFRAVE
jgi:hypothetical protein